MQQLYFNFVIFSLFFGNSYLTRYCFQFNSTKPPVLLFVHNQQIVIICELNRYLKYKAFAGYNIIGTDQHVNVKLVEETELENNYLFTMYTYYV